MTGALEAFRQVAARAIARNDAPPPRGARAQTLRSLAILRDMLDVAVAAGAARAELDAGDDWLDGELDLVVSLTTTMAVAFPAQRVATADLLGQTIGGVLRELDDRGRTANRGRLDA